ncbi:cytochrome c [Pseudooceanicola sp.]|uniref:c-type cytochrome n=1 Tax=Pseudooceanicola sp. TaxID=1914328 RepID=UPI003511F02E
MKFKPTVVAGLAIAALLGTASLTIAQDDKAAMDAIKARKATMQLFAYNLGYLGGVAKGEIEYDAAAASAAASNLAKLTTLDQSRYWLPGTDTASMGEATRALPALWEADSEAGQMVMQLAAAAADLDAAAGDGADAVRAALGPVGQACGACHKAYRQSDN